MNRTLALAFAAVLTVAPALAARAQNAPEAPAKAPGADAPQAYDLRDDASEWIKDPNVYAYYQATIEAFAKGPEHLDRAAFEKRSREIFRDLAVSRHMPPDALQNHLKAIPGEVVMIVTRDPKTLDSYDNFVVALFGPQKSAPGPVR